MKLLFVAAVLGFLIVVVYRAFQTFFAVHVKAAGLLDRPIRHQSSRRKDAAAGQTRKAHAG
jgi:hypothetical protein